MSTLDILTKAVRRYGTMQLIVAMEELAELQQALAICLNLILTGGKHTKLTV